MRADRGNPTRAPQACLEQSGDVVVGGWSAQTHPTNPESHYYITAEQKQHDICAVEINPHKAVVLTINSACLLL